MRLRRFFLRFVASLPFLQSYLPIPDLSFVVSFTLGLDLFEEFIGVFEEVGILFAPLLGELALEGLFEEGLAIDAELPPRPAQALLPGVQLAEQLLDLRDDPPLLGEGWEGDGELKEMLAFEIIDVAPFRNLTDRMAEFSRLIDESEIFV